MFTQFAVAAQACLLPQSLFAVPSGIVQASAPCSPQGATPSYVDPGSGESGVCLVSLSRGDQGAAPAVNGPAPAAGDSPPPVIAWSVTPWAVAAFQPDLPLREAGPPFSILFCRFQS